MFDYNNYQLYRSNVRLGGQMKYDIVVDSYKDKLYVSDFHITPVSDSCPFNRHTQETLLNYSHKENISRYYKQISGSFYNPFIDPTLANSYPLIQKNDEFVNNHDSTFEMGCKRMQSYQLYKKQFEFFCPVWLEKLDQPISFRFEVYGDVECSKLISTKTLELTVKKEVETEYHDKFVKYFNDWIEYVGLTEGNNSVMNINPVRNFASISGFNVSKGLKEVKSLPNLVINMFKREIPLMEFDGQIIRNFEDNKLITNQLINFNFCFNLEDIIKSQMVYMLQKQAFYVKMNVLVGGKELEKRDLFTNYEYIPKKSCDIQEVEFVENAFKKVGSESAPNVLSYLKDNMGIDYVMENKISPQIIHWSLVGNNSYIFNVYNGFGGYLQSGSGEIISLSHVYDNSANILINKNIKVQNSMTWCNMIKLEGSFNLNDLATNLDGLTPFYSTFSTDGGWVNNILYRSIKVDEPQSVDILVMFIPDDVYSDVCDRVGYFYPEIDCGLTKVIKVDDKFLFIAKTSDMGNDMFAYKGFTNTLKDVDTDESAFSPLGTLVEIMINNSNLLGQDIISLQTSVDVEKAKGPTMDTAEVEYYKNDSIKSEYMHRYFGKIRPTFVSVNGDIDFNYRYSKTVLKVGQSETDTQLETLNKYLNLGYLPKYPSIDYYYISKDDETYVTPVGSNNIRKDEWKVFDSNKLLMLIPEFTITLTNDENPEWKVDQRVKNFLREVYNTSGSSLDYINSLYKYEMSFEYKCLKNTKKLNYFLKITLK